MTEERDPFEGIADEPATSPAQTRRDLLARAKRGFVRIRKDMVQHSHDPRPSVLADLVTERRERALDLLLTVHALQPMLVDEPLTLASWARMIDVPRRPCTTRSVADSLRYLQGKALLSISGSPAAPTIELLRENGDGESWVESGADDGRGRGYFTVPFEYWTSTTFETLRLPGKAMLLILLKETQNPAGPLTFTMPVERAFQWYGISERTAERGYLELRRAGIMREKVQRIPDAAHPAGRREVHHRALTPPFSTDSRERLRLEAAASRLSKASP
ncbi:hypothetical protein [Cellulomonas sp. P5_E12]